jgi:hypothetical protein
VRESARRSSRFAAKMPDHDTPSPSAMARWRRSARPSDAHRNLRAHRRFTPELAGKERAKSLFARWRRGGSDSRHAGRHSAPPRSRRSRFDRRHRQHRSCARSDWRGSNRRLAAQRRQRDDSVVARLYPVPRRPPPAPRRRADLFGDPACGDGDTDPARCSLRHTQRSSAASR